MDQLTENQKEDLQGIVDISRTWLLSKKIGSITFNFFRGGIANYIKSLSSGH